MKGNQIKQTRMSRAKSKGMVMRKTQNPHCGSKSDGPFLDKMVRTSRFMQRVTLGHLFRPSPGSLEFGAGFFQAPPFIFSL